MADCRYRSVPVIASMMLLLAGLALWWAHPLDLALHHALHLEGAVAPVVVLSALGGLLGMGPLVLGVAGWLAWRGDRRRALWLVLTVAAGRLLVEGLKLLAERPRPPLVDRLEPVTSWSFPSSHSAGTMMSLVAFALLSGRRAAWWPALAGAGLVGWSRAALGVHWPSDVLAGWGVGLGWVGLCWRYAAPGRSA